MLSAENNSAVEFATRSRIHIALAVTQLEAAIAFYRTLFGQEPTKIKPHYAKFEVAEPPVNLSLNEVTGEIRPSHPVAHYGIQVKSSAAVKAMSDRLAAAGCSIEIEEQVSCCYAVQDKVWATDPLGNKWEIYVVLDNAVDQHLASGNSCCPPPASGASAQTCNLVSLDFAPPPAQG